MKNIDFRIGNLVLKNKFTLEGIVWEKHKLTVEDLIDIEKNPRFYNKIQMSKEILSDFGFREKDEDVFNYGMFFIKCVETEWETHFYCFSPMVKIDYVHQLQNLYHSIILEDLP